ncbi:hypothetical protein [Bacillus sp. COPE52]|uniref:hypothetical protein n=1 Tax=Bacillus sp. COPE52 TaxID=2233998 RepID=UPI000E10979D|nr:hypothetical protein [Bacillus sp. COPE52]AXK19123.1 hypothetical protein DPQ31_16055 [Bacillus sp. COPE52]
MAARYGSLEYVLNMPWFVLVNLYGKATLPAIELKMRWEAYINNPFNEMSFSEYLSNTGYKGDEQKTEKLENLSAEEIMNEAKRLMPPPNKSGVK